MGRVKYIIIDRELEEGFLVGDMKVAGAIIGRSHRTIEKWFYKSRYIEIDDRFIVLKDPLEGRRKYKVSKKFLENKSRGKFRFEINT